MDDLENSAPAAVGYPGPGKLFIIFTAVGVLTSLRFQFQRPPGAGGGQLGFALAFTASYYLWVALTPAVFRLEKRLPLGNAHWIRNLTVLALISFPVCLLASPVMLWLYFSAMSIVEPVSLRGPVMWLSHFPFAQVVFWSSVAGGYSIRTISLLREQERKTAQLALEKAQLETGLRQAQLDVLRARLNPHFLFNSLQNISVMTKQDPQTASRMLARLGDLLRAVLKHDSEPEHTLREEIDLARAYAALEQMRFGDRLTVSFDIEPGMLMALVPCFILQPIIENAVIHGLRGVRKDGIIAIAASRDNGDLVLNVRDNGVGLCAGDPAKIKVGVGLGSTRQRLATMYPERQSFSMSTPSSGGTEVQIVIPVRFGDVEEDASANEQSTASDRR